MPVIAAENPGGLDAAPHPALGQLIEILVTGMITQADGSLHGPLSVSGNPQLTECQLNTV
jgi:hypothetical protein